VNIGTDAPPIQEWAELDGRIEWTEPGQEFVGTFLMWEAVMVQDMNNPHKKRPGTLLHFANEDGMFTMFAGTMLERVKHFPPGMELRITYVGEEKANVGKLKKFSILGRKSEWLEQAKTLVQMAKDGTIKDLIAARQPTREIATTEDVPTPSPDDDPFSE